MVMKRTKWKHLVRSIRKGGVSYLAVAVIAAVSISIFHGFQSSGNAILQQADRYFNENNLETLEIACANGITQEDIDAIASWEGVTAVEGGYTDSVLLLRENDRILVQARSLLDTINQPTVVEGVLPAAADEAAIEENMAQEEGIQVGDTIVLEQDGCLTGDTFTVTAIVNIPVYSCVSLLDARGTGDAGLGSNEYYVCLTEDAFDPDYYSNCYTAAYIDSSVLDGTYYFSDAYESGEAAYLAQLEPLAQERAALRYESLQAEVDEELSDARAEIEDAQAEIDENEEKLSDARAEIADSEQSLADARTEIANKEAELEDAKADLAQGEADYADGQRQYNQQKNTLDSARSQINDQLTAMGLPTDLSQALTALSAYGDVGAPLVAAIQEYQAGESQLAAAKAQLDASAWQLNSARAEIADGEEALAEAKAELADAEQELSDAKAEIADSEQELADAKAEIADAREELADAEAEAADLQLEDWILSGRENVGDVRSLSIIVDTIRGLSVVMALLFLLVAVVICFSAITRVIREQRVLIGAQKALGFTAGEVFKHYTLYNLSCAVLGILFGWFLAVTTVETMSLGIFAPKFRIGTISLAFTWSTALLTATLCLAVFLIATFVTCSKMVKEPAIDLLRGDAPTRGKRLFFEKWGFYQKMNLYSRTMVKNVLSDKGRMMTTMVGVMGCTALLVACFSMKLGIQNASRTHFDHYASYDYRLVVDSETGSAEDFSALLDQEGISHTLIQDKLKNFRTVGGRWESTHVVTVSDAGDLVGFMALTDISTGEELQVPADGVLVSRRAAEELDLSVGSTIELMAENGEAKEAVVSGIIEHYLAYHLIVTSSTYYEEVMGESADPCVFLLQGDVSGLADKVQTMDGFLSLRDNSEYDRSGSELDMVIAICTILSAVMSVLVLLNQISMYISRKARELAVMRVNGYTMSQTKAYVYKDNIVLIILGLLVGCLFGVFMAYVSMRVIEAGAEHYVRSPNLIACLLSCAIMAVFAVVVNIIALRKINHLSLTNVSSN